MPVIEIKNPIKRFDGITEVDDISFSVADSSIMGLLGGNGAGKTTMISMLLGLLVPSPGTVRILGQDMLRHR